MRIKLWPALSIGLAFAHPLGAAAQTPAVEPVLINPADAIARGQIQCTTPDQVARTCHTMARITKTANGGYIDKVTTLLSRDKSVTLESDAEVRVADNMICMLFKADRYAHAIIRVDGKAITGAQADALIGDVSKSAESLTGHVICSRYVQNGSLIINQRAMDGTYQPQLDQIMIWVDASAGYRVAPSAPQPPRRTEAPMGR